MTYEELHAYKQNFIDIIMTEISSRYRIANYHTAIEPYIELHKYAIKIYIELQNMPQHINVDISVPFGAIVSTKDHIIKQYVPRALKQIEHAKREEESKNERS